MVYARKLRVFYFKFFSQTDKSITRKFGGTGLGLSICSKVVDAMEGKMFPHKILLVEDNRVNQELVVQMLERFGYKCDVVSNGREALDILSLINKSDRSNYSLIFMDQQMPVMDGIEASYKIIEKYNDNAPPIVAMTANAFKEDKKKCIDSGMKDFTSKLINIIELRRILKEFSNSGDRLYQKESA